jgi:hypothetical protein
MIRFVSIACACFVSFSSGLALAQSADAQGQAVIVPAPPPSYGAPTPSSSPVLDAQLGAEPETVHHMDRGFVSAGTTLFLVAWTMNIPGSMLARLLGSPSGDTSLNYDMLSLIPLAGPLAQLGFMQGIEWTTVPLLITEACEIAGLVMMIVGAIGVDETRGYSDLRVLPFASSTSAGLSVGGAW